MKFFTPRNRIAIGLTGAVTLVLCVAKILGYIPDQHSLASQARTSLAETIALGSSALIVNGDEQGLKSFMEGVASRNADVQSFSVIRSSGDVVLESDNHRGDWQPLQNGESSDAQIQVPIYQTSSSKWGTIQIRFTSLNSGWAAFADQFGITQMFFIGSACFLIFNLVLGLLLKQLDPSKAVPQRVRDALDNLAEGLLLLDTNYNILLANASFANVLGKDSDKLLGQRMDTLGLETDSESPPWQQALVSKQLVSNQRVTVDNPTGEQRQYHVNCSPLLGPKGKYVGVMVTFDDVTQLEQSRSELKVARDAADAANQAKSDFLANMSHEIRTPMNAILGFTDVLRLGIEESPEQRMEYLNTIHSSGSHLIELINEILDLSKVEAGKLELEMRQFGLPELLHEVVQVLLAKADQKGIGLSFDVKETIPATIQSDSTRIKQILINLVGNAVKFTELGEVKLCCCLAGDHLRFDVSDTGIGMTDEQLKNIFDPFSQADSSVTRRFGGTGLGLSICKKFAEALDGSISVTSHMGEGTTFSLRIPVAFDGSEMLDFAECQKQIQATTQNSIETENRKLNPAVVLVVDDAETNRNIVSVVLKRHGLEIIEAENGQRACEIMNAQHVDVVLMDMQMPVMDGYTATAHLRQSGFTIPIVAFTGNASEEDEVKSRAAGCNTLLPKPINIENLIATLGGFVGFSDELLKPAAAHQPSPAPCNSGASLTIEEPQAVAAWTSSLPIEDPEFFAIVERFVLALPGRLEGMMDLLNDQDWAAVRDEAHWLKGAAGTVGLDKLTGPAKGMEDAAKLADANQCETQLLMIVELASAIELTPAAEPVSPSI